MMKFSPAFHQCYCIGSQKGENRSQAYKHTQCRVCFSLKHFLSYTKFSVVAICRHISIYMKHKDHNEPAVSASKEGNKLQIKGKLIIRHLAKGH